MNYISQNSITIDRNINELVLNEIIAQNPEITSKNQAAEWIIYHFRLKQKKLLLRLLKSTMKYLKI
nr:hypothetical protein [Orientia tsutsugamushi]